MLRHSVLTFVAIMFICIAHLSAAQDTALTAEEIGLRDAHRKYLKAWSDHDIDTIVEMGTGSVGFGHSTAFPRPVREKEKFRGRRDEIL